MIQALLVTDHWRLRVPKLLGFSPDLDPTTDGIVLDCQNMIPSIKGMKAAPSPVASPVPALPEAAIGAVAAVRLDNTVRTFYGTSKNLYEFVQNLTIFPASIQPSIDWVVSDIKLTSGGAEYTSPPTIDIIGLGSDAVATCAIDLALRSIKVDNQGSGYGTSSAPVVNLTGGGGSGAVAKAVVGATPDGINISVSNGGAGYTSTPTVTISSVGDASGMEATATVQNGRVTSINITKYGSGYRKAPTVTISGGNPTTPATATAVITRLGINEVKLISPGTGYTSAPTVEIVGGQANPSGAALKVLYSTTKHEAGSYFGANTFYSVEYLQSAGVGVDYFQTPTIKLFTKSGKEIVGQNLYGNLVVNIKDGAITGVTVPKSYFTSANDVPADYATIIPASTGFTQAKASAVVNGPVKSITITNKGRGYTAAPLIRFSGGGGGTGAVASSTASSSLSLSLTSGGYGYANIPTITISGGGGSGVVASAKIQNGSVLSVSLDSPGSGYTSLPTVTVSDPENLSELTKVSRPTVAYTSSIESAWRFAQFGDATVATNGADILQQSVGTGSFVDIPKSPVAKIIEAVAGFVFAFDTVDPTYGTRQDGWWCCALYDQTNWVPSQSTQCANGRIVDSPGRIKAGRALGSDIVVYKDTSMFYGSYQGPPIIWSFRNISQQVGAPCQEAVVSIGTAHIFMGNDNFYVFDGTRPEPIGDEVKRWWLNDRDSLKKTKVASVHDHANSLVYFYYVSRFGNGSIDRCLVYNYKVGKWGRADLAIECAVDYSSGALTWNALGSISKTWTELPAVPYDSDYWTASSVKPAIIDTKHSVKLMTGSPSSSSLTTGDFGDDEQYTLLQQVRLRAAKDPTTATMTAQHRITLGADPETSGSSDYSDGKFDVDVSARWHRCIFNFTGDVELIGYTPNLVPDGMA